MRPHLCEIGPCDEERTCAHYCKRHHEAVCIDGASPAKLAEDMRAAASYKLPVVGSEPYKSSPSQKHSANFEKNEMANRDERFNDIEAEEPDENEAKTAPPEPCCPNHGPGVHGDKKPYEVAREVMETFGGDPPHNIKVLCEFALAFEGAIPITDGKGAWVGMAKMNLETIKGFSIGSQIKQDNPINELLAKMDESATRWAARAMRRVKEGAVSSLVFTVQPKDSFEKDAAQRLFGTEAELVTEEHSSGTEKVRIR